MATITAGSSKTFTAQVDNSSFVVIAPGGSIGQVVDQNGNIQPIGPNGTRRTFGPLNDLQSITVSMQIGNADVELNGWSGGIPITAETNSTGQTVLDDASRAALRNSSIGFLTSNLIAAQAAAKGNSPLDLAVMASPPTITVGAAAITNGQAYNYFDTDGYKRIRIKGVPFGDSSVMCENIAGYLRGANVGNSGGSYATANNAKHYL